MVAIKTIVNTASALFFVAAVLILLVVARITNTECDEKYEEELW